MKKYVIYARVSTVDKQSVESQLAILREYWKSRWLTIVKEYIDKTSGSKDSRPELDLLIDDAKKRKIDWILVFRFDRYSRSLKFLISSLELFQRLWIEFISYSENIDSSSSSWKLMFTMISAFAEFERNIIKERIMSWIFNAKQKWIILGRPKVDTDIEKIIKLKESWLSFRDIADKLKLKKSNVYNKYNSYMLIQV